MANSKNTATSILGIIAIILVIAAAGYYLMNEADDDEVELDIGLVLDGTAPAAVSPLHVTHRPPILFEV